MGAKYKELEEFQRKIERLSDEQMDAFMAACCKELAARLLAKVIKRTPVGKKPKAEVKTVKVKGKSGKTKTMLSAEEARIQQYWGGYVGGTLRRGWTGGVNKNAVEYANSLSIQKVGDKYHIIITNPVEYASYVEYGHRQAPGRYVPAIGKQLKAKWYPGHFMLTISENELNNVKEQILQAKLNKFMKDVFK